MHDYAKKCRTCENLRNCHGSAKTGYYLWPLIPVIHRSDLWIYMKIHGYLWSVCYIWMTFMGAAALCKLVELINFTPPLNKNTLWWIWTRIYWNTIISSPFSLNIGLTLLFHYIFIDKTANLKSPGPTPVEVLKTTRSRWTYPWAIRPSKTSTSQAN